MSLTMVVRRDDLRVIDWIDRRPRQPAEGQVLIRIDRFALTSNHITYAAFGVAMRYWDFFPTGDPITGCIPVWGFGVVQASACDGIEAGERLYGFWPMAESVLLEPVRVTRRGFVDGASHRCDLHPVYNHYLRTGADPSYDPALEAQQALLRPLFTTSFLIDDFLANEGFFGARTVLLSSASSKTAYGTAFCLAQRRSDEHAVAIVGLTSSANLAFTRSLGCYDRVVAYGDLDDAIGDAPFVYVDFSGNAALRSDIHQRLGDRLVYNCSVGGTHWEALGSGKHLPGPRPVLFFAPARVRQRIGDWGEDALHARIASAWSAFLQPVARSADPWLKVRPGAGANAIESCYLDLLAGRTDPKLGHFLSI